jgi:hypothetical protein
MMSLTLATQIQTVGAAMSCSQSLANRRLRLSQTKVRSPTQRRGRSTKPLAASERLMNFHGPLTKRDQRFCKPLTSVFAIGEDMA